MQTASNIAASAKSGMEKTKAVVQEKAEKMTTRDPVQKQLAGEKKNAKINEAERMKLETRAQQEAAKHGLGHTAATGATTGIHGTTGVHDPTVGAADPTGTGGVGSQYPTGTGHTGLHDPRVL